MNAPGQDTAAARDGSAAPPVRPRAVLVGPPGAGKTTVGELLARAWACGFRDTDTDVETAAGMSVADIFVEHGEEHFRAAEHAAVVAALTGHDGVLALGGGAIQDARTRAALRGHAVVFLDVGVHDAMARIGMNTARPLMLGNPRATFIKLLQTRRPLYEEVATLTVSTDGRTPEDVVAAITAALDAAPSGSGPSAGQGGDR